MEGYGLRFRKDLESIIRSIPEGKVARIGDIARAMGDIRASRAIVSMLPELDAPFWRVVREDMSVIIEGPEFEVNNGRALADIYTDFPHKGILRELRKEQEEMRSSLILEDREFHEITGVDIAYIGNHGFVALTRFDICGNHIEDYVHRARIDFPYIPTYLSYREGPAIIEAVESAPFEIESLMVDGNGILHPEHLGIASYIGIKLGIPTIGVAKSLLCGEVEWSEKRKGIVMVNGKKVGCALLGGRAKNPVYVSPGNLISIEMACETAFRFMKHRIPEPVRRAHRVATEFRDRVKSQEKEC